MTLREKRRLSDTAEAVPDDPRRAIDEATAIIEADEVTTAAKLAAHRLRAAAESRRPSPRWQVVRDDLEAALTLAEPFSVDHRMVTVDLANLASALGDDATAVALLTAPGLSRTEATEAQLAALLATAAINSDQGAAQSKPRELRSSPNQDAQPLLRVAPSGYERCLGPRSKGARVTVRFDVDERGYPDDVQVAETSDTCFDRSAVRAVKRWRYAPALVDGVAVRRSGVRTTVVFSGK